MVGFYNEKDNMTALTPGYKGMKEDSDESDSEFTPLYDEDEIDQRTAQETKGWNLFREIPVKKESGSMESKDWVVSSVKFLKVLAYIVVFLVVLGSAVLSKGTLLFITSQLKKGRQNVHCNRMLPLDQQFLNTHTLEERITWLWAALIAFAIPEVGIFLRSCRICFFKTVQKPTNFLFIIAFVIETLYAIGMALLVLLILPELDVIKGAMLANAMCIVPGILNAFSRDPSDPRYTMKIMVDVISVSMQLTAFVVWPLLNGTTVLWMIPVACTFISLGWWETFVSGVGAHSPGTMVYLQDVKENLKRTRYYTQRVLTIWKILVFMVFIMLSLHIQDDDPFSFFTKTAEAFGEREYVVEEVQVLLEDVSQGVVEYAVTGESLNIPVNWSSALWVALIQVLTAYVCFGASKFACKILIQNVSFTFAHTLVVPVTVNFLIMFCGMKNADPCAFHGTIPDYLFFYMPQVNLLRQYVGGTEVAWIWLLWLISQGWICFHTWKPKCERLAATDKLFTKPWYAGVLVDQSLLFHRTKDEDVDIAIEDLKYLLRDNASIVSSDVVKDVKPSDSITRIYTCATMWHETKDEMIEFLKSVMRLDEDQSARRVAQKYLGFVDPDYYELEANIFMDDAFELAGHNSEDMQANRFVQCLVDCIDEAASEVHLTNVRLRPPKKYPTPYGGRLVWTLPGKNKLICHLKDKMKIRHRKRWSQVMYMYYFLGHRLMDLPISVDRKEVIAENTYLLALDGDIDFKPEAVTLLIDLMKKDKNLGAACGRIHPMGSGFMAWYQMFEYAIGHWLQKATEHMIGCVLCSPGCFSLFRGKALMDDNVMKRYTLTSNEARHYVQYDQGEDRWLCTLLLQRGYRVEYSAASDAFTHCPEMFDEFFNQRRRWVPSTMANIFEMLACKNIVKVNDNISTIYILYQSLLMVGTVLGPGTIFLMMIGAMNSITGISNLNALYINLIPIMIFITVCLTCKSKTQLMLAMAITCVYAMIMMLVLVGVALQIVEDGWTAPSSVFFVVTFGSFFITAALHPQEFICLLYLFIYYITIPSMYMLLIIYSLCNLNDVSWGTRETVVKKSVKELEMERKEAEEAKKKMDTQSVLKWFGINKGDETSGSMEFSIAGLFRCMCCTNPKDFKEDLHLLKIANSIEKMEKKLDSLGAIEEADVRRRSSMGLRRGSVQMPELYEDSEDNNSTDIAKEDRDDLVNPYWIEDPNLQKGEVDFLTTAEIEFWKDLIDAYLRPIDEDKAELDRIATDLKNLRNTMVFAFLMLNALFIVVIFLLQMNQDQLHFKWPLGQDITLVYDDEANIITINQDYLMLEPIGSLFLIFFGSVMLIQFTAMLFHRMGTLTHLLATCNLNWYFTKRPEEMSDDAIIEKHAVQIAKDLQRLNTDDLERRGIDEDHVTRRKTLRNLEKARESKHAAINLDANFKRRLTILQDNDPDVMLPRQSSAAGSRISNRRATLRALKNRRESVIAERRRSQLQARDSTSGLYYDLPNQSLNDMTGRPSNAGAFMIKGYEPAFDSDDDEQLPRASTVRFREHYA